MTENETPAEVPNYKDLLLQVGPLENLLGSVSYNDGENADGKTQPIRTSARVFKKMKFDLTNNATEKKEKKEEIKPEEIKQEVKKPANPFWTSEEKKMFFEALNDHGKDFEAIHSYICTRFRKKGIPDDQLKTKTQIRHFYYKTFHALCGALKFNEKIPKNVQELYTLINYGEMRKKGGIAGKKNLSKLGDLITNGCIPMRLKGKTVKVKTPMCRALRRLNQLDEKYDDLKLPTRVLVELRPKDMASFVRVQSMAQNPRIKVALPLQKRLNSLLTCMSTRWRSFDATVYDQAVISTNPITKDCVPNQKTIAENVSLLNPLLRLTPPMEAHVELPSIDISEYFTGQSISLSAFETRKGVKKEEVEEQPIHEECVNKVLEVSTILELPKTEDKVCKIESIKSGWTLEDCGSLTIGELYLMFGADSKLVLEYSWDCLKLQEDEEGLKSDLSNPLKKLLSLAKLYGSSTPKCSCTAAKSTQFKKPLRVLKKPQVPHEVPVEDSSAIETKSENQQPLEPNNSMAHFFNQRDTIQRIRRGRGRFRQLVVERKLVPNKSESQHQIVTMNIISQDGEPSKRLANNREELPSLLNSDPNVLLEDNPNSNMSTGLTKILKENENQWITSEVADYSLSSLLGHLECPTKNNEESTQMSMSQDVDAQLRTLLIESSIDYVDKFADLAAQVVDNKK